MTGRYAIRAGPERTLWLEVGPGTSPTGEEGVLLIRRHPTEPLCLTFLSYEAATDLALAVRQLLPEGKEINCSHGLGYAALNDPPPGSRPPRDTGLPRKERER